MSSALLTPPDHGRPLTPDECDRTRPEGTRLAAEEPDPDRTRAARPAATAPRDRAEPGLPVGAAPPTRRRIRPVPPGPSVTFVPLPDPEADDWDRRADALQWWMADLGGPHPVTVHTGAGAGMASRTLERSLRDGGVDVIEANDSLIKGLLQAPPQSALARLRRWITRRPRLRLEIVEVRLERVDIGSRVTARAGGERAAESLRCALSELPPAAR